MEPIIENKQVECNIFSLYVIYICLSLSLFLSFQKTILVATLFLI